MDNSLVIIPSRCIPDCYLDNVGSFDLSMEARLHRVIRNKITRISKYIRKRRCGDTVEIIRYLQQNRY